MIKTFIKKVFSPAGAILAVLCLFLPQQAPAGAAPAGGIIIASFSTSVADQTVSVKQNIRLAADRLDGVTIRPGQTFDFNETVGEGSAANGFVDGAVMYREGIRMEPGGGLCQVSSTIYNAMLMAGFAIRERHRHYQPVTYVPLGLDATIKYGKKNLRMKNSTSQVLHIRVSMNEKSFTVILAGERKPRYRYVIETEKEEISIPFQGESKEGDIRPGLNIYVYRKKMRGNSVLERFLVYRDFYPPVYIK